MVLFPLTFYVSYVSGATVVHLSLVCLKKVSYICADHRPQVQTEVGRSVCGGCVHSAGHTRGRAECGALSVWPCDSARSFYSQCNARPSFTPRASTLMFLCSLMFT